MENVDKMCHQTLFITTVYSSINSLVRRQRITGPTRLTGSDVAHPCQRASLRCQRDDMSEGVSDLRCQKASW